MSLRRSLRGRRRRVTASRNATRPRQGASRSRDLSPPREHRRGRAAGGRPRTTSAPWPRRSVTLPALRLRAVARVAILAAEVIGLVLLVSRPAFAAGRIEVTGTKHLNRQQVLDRAGLTQGTSIFMISTSEAESELAGDPYIRTVSVRTALPDQVRVEVTEWEALALLTRGNAHYLLNQQGGVLGLTAETALGGPGQPRFPITQETSGGLSPGQGAINGRLVADMGHMYGTFPSAYGLTITRFVIQAGGQLVAETNAGPRILFGQMVTDEQLDSLDPKLAALKSLSGQVDLAHSKLDYVTLENPGAPATHTIPSPSPSPAPSATKKP